MFCYCYSVLKQQLIAGLDAKTLLKEHHEQKTQIPRRPTVLTHNISQVFVLIEQLSNHWHFKFQHKTTNTHKPLKVMKMVAFTMFVILRRTKSDAKQNKMFKTVSN